MMMALVPKGPKDRTTFAWTAITAVSSQTENPDLAVKAMVALTDGIHHWKVLAPRKSLATVDVIAAAVPGYEAIGWFGLLAPAGTPPATVAKLSADANRVLADPEVRLPGARRFSSARESRDGIEVPDELVAQIEKLCST